MEQQHGSGSTSEHLTIPQEGEYEVEEIEDPAGNSWRVGSKNQVYNFIASVNDPALPPNTLIFASNFKVAGVYLEGFRHKLILDRALEKFAGRFDQVGISFADTNLADYKNALETGVSDLQAAKQINTGRYLVNEKVFQKSQAIEKDFSSSENLNINF